MRRISRSASARAVGLVFCCLMAFAVLMPGAEGKTIAVGVRDYSDQDFLQSGYSGLPINLDTQTSSNFPKELNNSWYTNQAFFFSLSAQDITNDLAVTLDPAWSLSNATMAVAVDVLSGTNWVEAGRVSVGVSAVGAVVVPSSMLMVGTNNLRLRTVEPTTYARSVTWDQIIISGEGMAKILVGVKDYSANEFKQSNYTGLMIDLDHQTAADFPKELNNTWYTNQPFYLLLTPEAAKKDLAVTLDPTWSLSNLTMWVSVDILNGTNWAEVWRAEVGTLKKGSVIVSWPNLVPGINTFRIRASDINTNGPRSVVWDQIIVENKDSSALDVIGVRDFSSAEFQQSGYNGLSIDVDHQTASNFPQELNNTWFTNQPFNLVLTPEAQRKDLAITLNPNWCMSNAPLDVAVDVLQGTNWFEMGRVNVLQQLANVVIVGWTNLSTGVNNLRIHSVDTGPYPRSAVWDQIIIESKLNTAAIILGTRDRSSQEFKQSNYTTAAIDVDHQTVADFPKELNDSWHTNQDFYFILNGESAGKEMAVTLDPAWIDNTNGTLTVSLQRFNGSAWVELGRVDINDVLTGLILVPASNFVAGVNQFRLSTVRGNNGAHSLVWDQIIVESTEDSLQIDVGTKDKSSQEFKQSSFTGDPIDILNQTAADFPQELNDSWYTNQTMYLILNEAAAAKNLTVTLYPAWANNPTGTLTVAVDTYGVSGWTQVGQMDINPSIPGNLIISYSNLVVGFNDFRLRTIRGNNGLHSLTWDQIDFKSRELDGTTGIAIGQQDYSDLDFKQSDYTQDYIDLDHASSKDIPKELNLSWYTNLNMYMWLDSAQVSKDLVFVLDPAWNSATGSLNVALDIWNGTSWQEAAAADINGQISASLVISASQLTIGYNYFRLRAVSSNGTTTVITWDQIQVQSRDVGIAHNNSYSTPCAEEDNLNVPFSRKNIHDFRVIATHPRYYPQDLNQSASDFTGCDWAQENSIRLRVVSGTNGSHYLYWDDIKVENHQTGVAAVSKLVGVQDNSSAEFLQDNYFWWTDIDATGSTNFARELNDSWFSYINFIFWLNEDQVNNDLSITLRSCFTDGTGSVIVAMDVLGPKNDTDWIAIGTNSFHGTNQVTFTVPASLLRVAPTNIPPPGFTENWELFDTDAYVVQVSRIGNFWLGVDKAMTVNIHVPDDLTQNVVMATATGVHYVCVYRREALPPNERPQFIGFYQDGYTRLLPQPPTNGPTELSMGPSTILGPAEEAFRPYTQISNVDVYMFDPFVTNYSFVRFVVTYTNGTSARWDVSMNNERCILDVRNANYDTVNLPFLTLRSMWVNDGESDTDRLITRDMKRPILSWRDVLAEHWFFTRDVPSYHQTTNPDLTIQVLDGPSIYLTRQAEYMTTGIAFQVDDSSTASGGKCVLLQEPGEVTYDFDTSLTRSNSYIQMQYSDGRGGNIVTVYLDGVRSGQFVTSTTGDWGTYEYSDRIPLGTVTAGHHKLRITSNLNPDGYMDGMKLDLFQLLTMPLLAPTETVFATVQATALSFGSGYQFNSSTGAIGGLDVYFPTNGQATYYLNMTQSVAECYMRLRYATTIGPNTMHVYVDGSEKAKFPTRATGGKDSFENPWPLYLGALTKGTHELMITMEALTNSGVWIDQFTLHYINNDPELQIGESGTVTVGQPKKIQWQTVNLTNHLYTTPVVIMQPLSCSDTNPAHIRVKNVQRDRFQFQIEEWAYEDGIHGTETVSYVVMEKGQHRLSDGRKIEVGLDPLVGTGWKALTLNQSFTGTPVVLAQSQTANESDPIVTRQMLGSYATSTNTVPSVSTNPVRLAKGYAGSPFNGLLDEVKIFGSVVPDEDITLDYSKTTLAAYWKFDEAVWNGTSNEVLDASTNQNRGRSYNGACTTNDAKRGRAAYLDGTNDYVDVQNKASLQVTSNMTISFWIKGRNLGKGRFNPVDKNYGGEFSLVIETNRSLSYYQGQAQASGKNWTWTNALAVGALTNGVWQHVAIVRDTGTRLMQCYLNGVLKSSTNYPANTNYYPTATTNAVSIGKGFTGSYLGANLDELKISRSAWTAAAVAQEYGQGAPAAYWACDETSWSGVSNDVVDSSGNGNNGKAYGGATTTNDAKSGRAGTFNGTNAYVEIPNSTSLQIKSNLTISFWIKPRNIGAARASPVDKSYGGEFSLMLETNASLTYSHGTACTNGRSWSWTALPAGSFTNNAWSSVTIARDDNARQMKSFLNGVLMNTTTSSFVVKLQEEQNLGPHANESVGYIALERGAGLSDGVRYEVGETPDAVTNGWYTINFSSVFDGVPSFLANLHRDDDDRTAAARYRSLNINNVQVRAEGEQSKTQSMDHATESVGYLLVDPATTPMQAPVH